MGGLSVPAEVKRPEGPILCVMAGKPYPADDLADSYALTMNDEKARAQAAGHESVLLRLEEQELDGLVERVGSAKGKPQIVLRAPRLRQVILDANGEAGSPGEMRYQTGARGSLEAILTELLSRSAALFLMRETRDNGIAVRTYGAAGSALPVYADPRCLEWAAEDLARVPGSFKIAAVHPRELIAMAAAGKLGIAICTYRDRKMPIYAILPDSLVKTMAKALKTS